MWTHPELMHIDLLDVLTAYPLWPAPTVIISDGAYGIEGFKGDPATAQALPAWYAPHVEAWARSSTPETTLWFWNTEVGWATVHPILENAGWVYRGCNIWNKGMAHVSGNTNTQTLRKFPVVTEVCVQYVRKPVFTVGNGQVNAQDWLRSEWKRTGLPWSKANEACGVKNAATRKYLTADHLWYFPPPAIFEQLAAYANEHGQLEGKPYFSIDGQTVLTASKWERYWSVFHCPIGVTNVWDEPTVRNAERLKTSGKVAHLNQKPFRLMERIILASSDPGDVVWEPFGGLCTGSMAANYHERQSFAAEIDPAIFGIALERSGLLMERDRP